MKATMKTLKGKIFSYSEIRRLLVGACVSDPQIHHETRLVGGVETNINAISHFVEELIEERMGYRFPRQVRF